MQVFNLFFKIARSKLGIMVLYLAVFLAICFPMVKATTKQSNFQETSVSLCIFDEDRSEASRKLIETLSAKNNIVDLAYDRQKILDAMYFEMVDYVLVIKGGYEERLVQQDEDVSDDALFETYHMHDSYAIAMMNLYLNDYVRTVRMKTATGLDLPEAINVAEQDLAREVPVEIVADPEKEVKDENFTENFAVFFRLLSYLFVAVITNALCPILMSLNSGDQRKRIECSQVSTSSVILQTFAGSAVLVLLIWLAFMAGGMIIYGGLYKGTNIWLAVFNSLLFALLVAMLSIFLCSFRLSTTAVGMLSQILGLGMAFLCGAFLPQSMLDAKVLAVGKILPPYWYIRANDILSGAQTGTMRDVWICFGVEAGFFLLFLVLTILLSSRFQKIKRA